MTSNAIEIDGIMWIISLMLDENRERTDDPNEACHLIIQKPQDIRPEGTQQPFSAIEIMKGSLVKELSH